ncbi:P-loop containing nucleoside triphosphate hydrolase protein [Immersiella caudata]|uniref:P-loop containing nucleoside triphosphate hydrolase protein n=1 Tax=Immersiella caudata TaxID=314043 RepID=A0AA39WER0_9PEZI|nr:P-loop containing nucleoside triphosphate hydrolase protein [Immersiella caudata]
MDESAGFVILMGMTGAGKSTFISRLTGLEGEVGVGHTLSSTTAETACYTAQYDDKRIIHLIDTPGFDDTARSDADILNTISTRLSTLYRAHQPLLGIIFLHRITDVRLGGSAIKNFNILQRLCGPANYDRIVLATTMWSEASHRPGGYEAAVGREDRLWGYWSEMFQEKSKIVRHHTDSAESARTILSCLVDHTGAMQPLQIQRELVDERMTLNQTGAGRYVRRELLAAKEKLDRELAELQRAVEDTARKVEEEASRTTTTTTTTTTATTGDVRREVVRAQTGNSAVSARSAKRKRTDEIQMIEEAEYPRRPSLRGGPGSVTGSYWRVEGQQEAGGQQQPDEWTRYIPKVFLNWFPGSDAGRQGGIGIITSKWPSIFGSSKPGESSTSLAYGPGS